jgi:hypothetical protein
MTVFVCGSGGEDVGSDGLIESADWGVRRALEVGMASIASACSF